MWNFVCYSTWARAPGTGEGAVKEGLLWCFDKKQRKWPPQKILKPERNVNFAKGNSPIWPQPLCAAEQGMVFRVLGLEQIRYTISLFSLLYEVPFWTASLKMSVNFGILISWVTVTIHHDNGGHLSCLLCEELHALWSLNIYNWNLQILNIEKTHNSRPFPNRLVVYISQNLYEVCDQTQPGCLSLVRPLLGEICGNQVDPGTKIIQNVAMAICHFYM